MPASELGEAEADTLIEGLREADGLRLALGEMLAEALTELEGLTEDDADTDGDTELDGLILVDADGDTELDGLMSPQTVPTTRRYRSTDPLTVVRTAVGEAVTVVNVSSVDQAELFALCWMTPTNAPNEDVTCR